MKTNDIISLYVGFIEGAGGKNRPVLVRKFTDSYIEVFKITSKYTNKSEFIKRQYYKIINWKQAGLNRESWVDIGTILQIPNSTISFKKIGRLSIKDQIEIDKFNDNFINHLK
ncbi:hypothetical protein [Xylocopilactobacillus apis]|uniref:MazF family toxin-antitoxin system n=1 Tax=Xylocopilactobacillus apis TaxID=2932183 RepID=A0AAU9DPA2_9LACO|nr:hypothetical protein [Xylocopilactobacillus apis]BDR56843.1 MazF family toxin-antitoxin system [Xylocopilactobacillus apis]